jgi:hypothetical protein
MTSPGGLTVTPAALRAHAGHVEQDAGAVEVAKQAADVIYPGLDAYGKLCLMVPVMLGDLQDTVVAAIAEAGTSLRNSAQRVRDAADLLESADLDGATDIDGVAGND